jgi:tetratricopeptide (TPR) repeat protein
MLAIKNRVTKGSALLLAVAAGLVGCAPPGPSALLQGARLIDERKYSEALVQLRRATSLMPTNAAAWNYLGLACQYSGQPADAEKAYSRALTLNRDLSEAHYNLGCLLLDHANYDGAKAHLTAYTLRRGGTAEALTMLGAAQLRSHELAAAEKSLTDALKLNPRSPEALNLAGVARAERGRFAEAIPFFNNALSQQPNFAPAVLNLAVVSQVHLKDRQAALKRYREYLSLNPPADRVEQARAAASQLELELTPVVHPPPPVTTATPPGPATNIAKAPVRVATPPPAQNSQTNVVAVAPVVPTRTNPIAEAPKPPPTSPPVRTQPVETVEVASDPSFKPAQEVAMNYNKPAASSPSRTDTPSVQTTTNDPPKRGFLQRINPLNLIHSPEKSTTRQTSPASAGSTTAKSDLAPAGDAAGTPPDTAQPSATKGMARYAYKLPPPPTPGNREAADRLCAQGFQSQESGRLQEAIQSYRAATQQDPSFFRAQYNLALALAQSGSVEPALYSFEKAMAASPESVEARLSFALTLKQARYYLDSAQELEKVAAESPADTRAHLALGNLYSQQLHQPSRARQHYLKVLETDPGHPQASSIHYWLVANPP